MEAPSDAPGLHVGDPAPPFDLPGVDGESHSVQRYADKDVLVVMFTCNHCPYVQATESRLVEIQRDYADKGVQLVAINSNDSAKYPEDSFDEMVKRAERKGFNFPYLRDKSQEVAKAYGAVCTPEMFVFDKARNLRYRGKVDDNWEHPDKVKRRFLREALDEILAGKEVTHPWEPAIGCSIKWIW
jgi:peroxiredoxin